MSTTEASLSGVVTDSSSGEPINDAVVTIINNSNQDKQLSATTGSSGAYSIQSIPVGTYIIVVQAVDYSTSRENDVSLPAGNTELNFKLSEGGMNFPLGE